MHDYYLSQNGEDLEPEKYPRIVDAWTAGVANDELMLDGFFICVIDNEIEHETGRSLPVVIPVVYTDRHGDQYRAEGWWEKS